MYHLLQVVVGTNASLGLLRTLDDSLVLSNPIVFLDEAGQATEPSALIPLTMGAEWVMMTGDLKQLRPTIHTSIAMKELGYSKKGHGGSIYGRWAPPSSPTHT